MTQPSTIYLETMGCQMNALDSELVMGELLSRGYRPTEDLFGADLVVINTCSVRQHAEDKVHSRIGELSGSRGTNPGQIVAVIGCMAERDGEALLARNGAVDVLCGPGDLHRLPGLIEEVRETRRPAVALSGKLRHRSTPHSGDIEGDLETLDRGRSFSLSNHVATPKVFGRHQAYVRITRGCNKYCSFCVVPLTRGPETHRPPDSIVDEVRRLAATGVVEVTLLGQTVNHYHYCDGTSETSFATLLKRIHDEVPELPRLRFVTSFPRDFTDEALEVMAACQRICRYLHIPAQSGSDAVLKRMNRGYTVEQYMGLLDRARAIMPDISLSGDLIVGFPGESEDDFRKTSDLLRFAQYKNCYIFKYSPRPGTVAHDRLPDDVPEEVKRRRNNDLLALQSQISLARNRVMIDEVVEVLVEGPSKRSLKTQESEQDRGCEIDWSIDRPLQLVGRTSGDQIVVLDGSLSLVGRLVNVQIAACTPYTLHGRLVEKCEDRRRRDLALAVL